MGTTAKTREILIGFGFAKQAAIATANTVAGIWRLNKLNASYASPTLNTENDAPELGKGHEFATRVFKTSWDVKGQIEKYLSSDFAAWVMAFGLGTVAPSGTLPNYIYTCTPLDPTAGLELPYFSFIEQIRPGASSVINRMAVGCAIEDWTLTIGSGPGRANSKLACNFIGCGKQTVPSGITLPLVHLENLLPSASLACTINGTNYVSNKNIVSLEATWKNNLKADAGFFPGSGFQESAAVKQVDTITLTGSSGTATVTLAGSLTKVVTYGDSLTDSAGDFVTSWATNYDGAGIVITSSGPQIIFTAKVAGTAFVHPVITNTTLTLAGTVAETTANSVSGETSGAVRGRLEVGDRELGLTLIGRFDKDSDELTKLQSQTEGTAVISLTYDTNNSLSLTYQRVSFSVVELGDTDGIVTVQVTVQPLYHASNGLLTAVAKCNTAGIGASE
jgi:hypothetical protein